VTLCLLALSSLAFAPAPLPRRDREAPHKRQERLLAECVRRLDELGVKWQAEDRDGRRSVRFTVAHPSGNSGMGGDFTVHGGDLPGALRRVIRSVEAFLKHPNRL
jgi:hypothetical protein